MENKADLLEAEQALEIANVRFERPEVELIADLQKFQNLLTKWQKIQNLVSRETLSQFWLRHVADSLQLLAYIPDNIKRITDFGSGGGLPAIVLAIALKDKAVKFTLVEANSRKVAFLRAVVRELGLNAQIIDSRIEDCEFSGDNVPQMIIARAVAPLIELLRLSKPISNSKTVLIFPKGKEYTEELTKANGDWCYNVVIHSSVTNKASTVLEITDFTPKNS